MQLQEIFSHRQLLSQILNGFDSMYLSRLVWDLRDDDCLNMTLLFDTPLQMDHNDTA